MKLASSVEDVVNGFHISDWKPDKVIFVSGNGFDQDAISIAESKDIICYERTVKGFRRI